MSKAASSQSRKTDENLVPEGKDCDWPSDIGTGGWTQDGFIPKQIILSDPRPPIASTEAGYNGEQMVGGEGMSVC